MRETKAAKLQRCATTLRNEAAVAIKLVDGVVRRGFPEDFRDFLKAKADECLVTAEQAAQFYAAEIIKAHATLEEIRESTAHIDTRLGTVEQELAKARKGVFADIKRNSAPA